MTPVANHHRANPTATARTLTVLTLAAMVLGSAGHPAYGACNTIPSATRSFRAALGTTDRPFAMPGDLVQVRLQPARCDAASAGFDADPRDNVVSVIFTPPAGGPRQVVVLATSCSGIASCPGVPTHCRRVNGPGEPTGLMVTDSQRLTFRFPDTDDLLDGPDDDRTLTGPATIAVTRRGEALPCALAAAPCIAQSGMVACVDDFFPLDGTCRTAPGSADPIFGHFTALPPPNSYQALCTAPAPPCTGTAGEIHVTTDAAGNLLAPVDWQGVLVRVADVPVPRLLRTATSVEAFVSAGPIRIPGLAFSASFTPEGAQLPPIFEPQVDPTATNELTLFGSADAPLTVLRFARRSPIFRECAPGSTENPGLPCTVDADCGGGAGDCQPTTCRGGSNPGTFCDSDLGCLGGGECGPALFEFRDRLVSGVGPIAIPRTVLAGDAGVCEVGPNEGDVCQVPPPPDCPGGACVDYRVRAEDPVPLEGLTSTPELFAFAFEEAIAGGDLNGDGDAVDTALKLSDRDSGVSLPIGTGGAEGRAVARLSAPPFSFPAVAVEGDVVAFLEPEAAQGYVDVNQNGEVFDTILRVFRRSAAPPTATEVTTGVDRTTEAAGLVSGRGVAVSDGRVFFRLSEAAAARRETTQASLSSGAAQGNHQSRYASLSADGQIVAFSSLATNLTPEGVEGVFVRDRGTSTTEFVGRGELRREGLSADGQVVAFSSFASDLVAGDTNGTYDVFVRDRGSATTERMSVDSNGTEGNGVSTEEASVSANGRLVAFRSHASNLVPGDTNGVEDVFLRDRDALTTVRVSVGPGGIQTTRPSDEVSLSADGRLVSFHLQDPGGGLFVHDHATGITEAIPGEGFDHSLSADGRVVVFSSNRFDLVSGDTNGAYDVFVYDRQTGLTERVSVAFDGTQANSYSSFGQASGDGRFVVFESDADNLVPDDTNEPNPPIDLNTHGRDVFVRDRLTGTTRRASVATSGQQQWAHYAPAFVISDFPTISTDGRVVAWSNVGTGVGPGAGDPPVAGAFFDVFVRTVDPADCAADLTADCDLDDTLLYTLDATSGAVTALCQAETVAVAGGAAAFLRPEAAGAAPTCPADLPSLNGDADDDDAVVHLWRGGGSVENLGLAAGALAMSDERVAALVDETAQGGSNLNASAGDGDTLDTVLHVYGLAGPGSWTNVEEAADVVDVSGSLVAFIQPELAQAAIDRTGDTDVADRVLRLYDATSDTLIPVIDVQTRLQPAEEFVLGASAVAFRSQEGDFCGVPVDAGNCASPPGCSVIDCDLNDDGDCCDAVLQVYDVGAGALRNTGQAVRPCRLETCDPRLPYRVFADRVRFLTFECDQGGPVTAGCAAGGTDLNGDGDAGDLVIQVFDLLTGEVTPGSAVEEGTGGLEINPLDAEGGGGTLTLGVGRCLETLGEGCSLSAECGNGAFCDEGACKRDQGVCATDGDCPASIPCAPEPIVPASPDTDGDGVLDALDDCPEVPDPAQSDTDADGVGDACDLETCGNGVRELAEACDGGDAAACPGGCLLGCTCPCAETMDASARVVVRTTREAGILRATLTLPLPGYSAEPVTIRLDDGDLGPIAIRNVGTLAPRGSSGKTWQFGARGDGLQLIKLKDLRPTRPGFFRLSLRARRWFSAAQADEDAPSTRLTVAVGSACFVHAATLKVD